MPMAVYSFFSFADAPGCMVHCRGHQFWSWRANAEHCANTHLLNAVNSERDESVVFGNEYHQTVPGCGPPGLELMRRGVHFYAGPKQSPLK